MSLSMLLPMSLLLLLLIAAWNSEHQSGIVSSVSVA
jgi:hypothetical protein